MTMASPRHKYAEEYDLVRKRKEFHDLELRLAKLKQERGHIREEIAEFEKIYVDKMAGRLAELEALEKELSRYGRQEPFDHNSHEESPKSGFCQDSSHDEKRTGEETPIPHQGENLKDIYRKVAKSIHPDLSTDEEERHRRQKLMAEANRAYMEEDRISLLTMMDEYEVDTGRSTGNRETEWVIVNRGMSRLTAEIRVIEGEIALLTSSEIYRLVQRVEKARWQGLDLFVEIAEKLDVDIMAACNKLNEMIRLHRGIVTSSDSHVRTVSFPEGEVIGALFVRNRESRNFLSWRKIGKAVGKVAIPSDKTLRLDIDKGRVPMLDLLSIAESADVKAFYLYDVNDAELAHVLRFKETEELFISGKGITGEGLVHLLELVGLERLYLYDTAIEDAGLLSFKYMRRLKSLTLCNAPVTLSGIERLKAAMPYCTIVNFSNLKK